MRLCARFYNTFSYDISEEGITSPSSSCPPNIVKSIYVILFLSVALLKQQGD